MRTLAELRQRLRAAVAEAARSDIEGALSLADAYGWERLLGEMDPAGRVRLVNRLVTALKSQRELLEATADAYDTVLSAVGNAADIEVERLDRELEQAIAAEAPTQRGPGWFTVILAGVGGYWLGKRR
jgi:hypothetical protein